LHLQYLHPKLELWGYKCLKSFDDMISHFNITRDHDRQTSGRVDGQTNVRTSYDSGQYSVVTPRYT